MESILGEGEEEQVVQALDAMLLNFFVRNLRIFVIS
jgi:hypothetical protein